MGVRVESLGVPLVGSVTEHQALVASTEIRLLLVPVHGGGDVGILRLNVSDDLAVNVVEAYSLRGVTNLSAHVTGNLLEVNLISSHGGFSEEYNLRKK
jgi:hypothetical protein